mmetsp:Transcript_18901/g.59162  ORF Transcript_18901/g.59162 Transcript_18901/m.59162 type:complete len:125 (+) Transcript_18901:272-646(+)
MRLLWLSARRDHCLAGGGAVAAAECDLLSRVSAGSRVHHAHTGTGALALACAAAVPGTVAHELLRGGGGGGCGGGGRAKPRRTPLRAPRCRSHPPVPSRRLLRLHRCVGLSPRGGCGPAESSRV